MRLWKKTTAWLMVACLSTPVYAGSQLNNALDGMFVATTAPQGFSTPNMQGVAFGSLSARFPIQNFNIISFDPPRLNAGCSGIDMYMGSFGFINAEQLKTMMRAIVQGAVGFAFKAAIRTMCGSCAATLKDLEEIMQRLNAMGKNTCALSKMLGKSLSNMAGFKETDDTEKSLLKSAKADVDGWWNAYEKERINKGNTDKSYKYNGNLTFRALFESGVAERIGMPGGSSFYGSNADIYDLAMNLAGSVIVFTGDKDNTNCSSTEPSGSNCTREPKPIVGHMTFDHLRDGKQAETGSANNTYWTCDTKEEAFSCQNPSETTFNFIGTRKHVQNMIFGVGSEGSISADGIIGTILASGPAGLTSTQKNFLSRASGFPIMSYIYRMQRDKQALQSLMEMTGSFVADDMAVKFSRAVVMSVRTAFTSANKDMPEQIAGNLRNLEAQANAVENEANARNMEKLKTMDDLVEKVERQYPKASAAWLRKK